MKINYEFVPEFKSAEAKFKSDVVSYAGKLLEMVGTETLIVSVDDEGRPVVWQVSPGRLIDVLDVQLESY